LRKECTANNCECCNPGDTYSLTTHVDFKW